MPLQGRSAVVRPGVALWLLTVMCFGCHGIGQSSSGTIAAKTGRQTRLARPAVTVNSKQPGKVENEAGSVGIEQPRGTADVGKNQAPVETPAGRTVHVPRQQNETNSISYRPIPADLPRPENDRRLKLAQFKTKPVKKTSAIVRAENQVRQATEQESVPEKEESVPEKEEVPHTSSTPEDDGPRSSLRASPGPDAIRIPLEGEEAGDNVQLSMRNGSVSLVARNASLQSVLSLLAQQQGLNLITADNVTANVTVTLTNVPFEDALNSIVAIAGCTWTRQKGIVLVTMIGSDSRMAPDIQGKLIQVFPLNFVSAVDLELTIKGLLSPVGQIFTTQMSPTDKRRTQEQVVVEDIPASVERIAQYIAQVDQPPRQVLIEAHVLQVELKDEMRHGVNWQYIAKVAGSDLSLLAKGFANPLASPASFLSIDGENLHLLVEALKSTTDAKTLANPKVLVANGQEARIQIGSKLGYFVTMTTQTSTLQNVNFLNTGVVLRVTPQISNDGRVLMMVRPEVSTGSISSAGLPQTQTTEADTTVLMEDGGGMVIGGLIKETDSDSQEKIPFLGDLWLVGRAFQRRVVSHVRNEIIIVLVPRIAPYSPDVQAAEQAQVAKARIPLFQGALEPVARPWDPVLPDAIKNPVRLLPYRNSTVLAPPWQTNPETFPQPNPETLSQPNPEILSPPNPDPVSQPDPMPFPQPDPKPISQSNAKPLRYHLPKRGVDL